MGTGSTFAATQAGTYTVTVTKTGMTGSGTSDPIILRSIDPQNGMNYVATTSIPAEGVTNAGSIGLLQSGERHRAVTYIGGIGNTLQTIVWQTSPAGKDLVQPEGYDVHGRQLTNYLPYISAGNNAAYRPLALDNSGYTNSEQFAFYQQTGQKIATDTKPYLLSEIEPSPLARLKSRIGAGDAWHSAGKKVTQGYTLNRATNNIRLWRVSNSTGLPVSSAAYGDYTLFVSTITDENGHQVKTFTDKSGRVVQKEEEISASEWLRTVHIYNDLGQRAYTLTPKGVASLSGYTPTQAFLDQWAFQYRYDDRGRVIETRAPGADWAFTVYDILNRPVMTQNADLRSRNEWAFVKYDVHGRAIVSGIKAISGSSRASVQGSVNSQAHNFEIVQNNAVGYTLNRSYPSANESELLTIQYYDHYGFIAYTGWDAESHSFTFVPELGHTAYATRVHGLATGGKVRIVGGTTWLNAVQYYDEHYRPVQVISENHKGGLDRSTNRYNTLRQLAENKLTHQAGETVAVVQKFTYDHAGRITHLHHNIDEAPSDQLVAKYEYNELGQLVDKKLHNSSGNNFLQSVDLRYNIRGWLRSINGAQLTTNSDNDDGNDLFGMEVLYNTTDGALSNTGLFNGNISALKWKGPGAESGTEDQQSYKYTYDRSDRLLNAVSQVHNGTDWTKEVGVHNESMTYDANGNILTLDRNQRKHGLTGLLASYTADPIDDLTYTYDANNGNRLKKVEDAPGLGAGFVNGANATEEYTYNADGALTSDQNKGISSVVYNVLGKPLQVNFTDGRKLEYAYSASGSKLWMKTYAVGGSLQTTTDYVGGFVYENNALKFFGSPEGRVVKNGSSFEYQYAIADHQGNTRVVLSSATPRTG